MQPGKQPPPGTRRTPDAPMDPAGDEYIDYDEAVEDLEEDEDTAPEDEEEERGEDAPLSQNETKDITA